MANTIVYLIRHGEIDNQQGIYYGRNIDLRLSSLGEEQVKKTAQRIRAKSKNIAAIYTSPLSRAIESAEIIADAFNKPEIKVEENLTDVDIPALMGHSMEERDEIHRRGTDEYDEEFAKKGNEAREDIARRIIGAFNRIVAENKGETVVVVGHGDPIVLAIWRLQHPEGDLPPVQKAAEDIYLQKGEACKLVFSSEGKLLEVKDLRETSLRGEKLR